MPVEPKEAGSPQDWLRHARSDLALSCMPKTRTILYQHLCFHAQQAAEKALKAVLAANGVYFPKTHDLAFLMEAMPSSSTMPPSLIDLPTLNQYAVQQRYPGELQPVTRKHHNAATLLAEEAVAWAARCIARRVPISAESAALRVDRVRLKSMPVQKRGLNAERLVRDDRDARG